MRSQMAEVFYNHLTKTHDATSAGAYPELGGEVSKRAIQAMSELDISLDGHHGKVLSQEMIEKADKVILFPTSFMPDYALSSEKAELWDVIDPHYHHEQGMELVRAVRDDIGNRVKKMIQENA